MNFLRQSTAAQSRTIGPFVDDTDFKTAETSLTIANTDIKLMANGAASANKNSGGGTHRVNGLYGVTFDATDTAIVGELEVSVVVAGALPVFKSFFVIEPATYDALFADGAVGYVADQPVNVTKVGGTTQTARDLGASVLLSVGTGAGQVNLASGKVPATIAAGDIANDAITAAAIAANAIDASALAADAVSEIQSGLASQTSVDDLPTNAELATALGTADDAVLAAVAALETKVDTVDTVVDGIAAKTVNLPADPADASDIAASHASLASGLTTINNNVLTVDGVVDGIAATLGAAGAGLTAIPWNAAWDAQVESEVADALTAYAPATAAALAALQTDVDDVMGVTDKLDTMIEADGDSPPGGYRLTAEGLEQAPSGGGGGGTDWTADERTAIRTILGVPGSGTTPTAPSAGALKVIDDEIAALQTSVDDVPTNAELAARTLAAADYATAAVLTTKASQASVDDLPTNAELATALAAADDAVLAAVATRASQTSVDDLPTNAELATALGTADDAVLAQLALVKAKTDNLPSDPADASDIATATNAILSGLTTVNNNVLTVDTVVDAIATAVADKTGYRLSATGVNDILRSVLTEGYAAEGAECTLEQAMYLVVAILSNRDIVGTLLTARKLDGTTPAATFTLDNGTTPTAQVRAT